MIKKVIFYFMLFLNTSAMASTIIPVGNDNTVLYYKIGGSNGFSMPPVSGTDSINLNTTANLGLGYSCSASIPHCLSVTLSMN